MENGEWKKCGQRGREAGRKTMTRREWAVFFALCLEKDLWRRNRTMLISLYVLTAALVFIILHHLFVLFF